MAKATQGIYLRNLRAIFNEAIADGIISKEKCYPFGRRKYQIPTGRNIKKALKLEQIEKTITMNRLAKMSAGQRRSGCFAILGMGSIRRMWHY